MKRPARSLAATAALTLALLAGCGTPVVNPVTGRTERTLMDEPAEIEEGRKAHQQVVAEYGVLDAPALQAYVNNLGQKLATHSHRTHLEWTFTVLDSSEINAFALPGGYVYVTRGLLAYLESEADLAGVIGHEIGHVSARHGAQRATSAQRAGFGVMAVTLLGAFIEGAVGVRGAADAATRLGQNVAAVHLASYSREQESQADALGALYLARSRYKPSNMVDVIQVLKSQENFAADEAKAEGRPAPGGSRWLASHPSNDQRLADIQRVAAGYDGDFADDGRGRFLKAIEGLPFGDSPAHGVVRGSSFYHQGLGIALTAPDGWQLRNGDTTLVMTEAGGQAALVLVPLHPDAGSDHEEIIRKLVKPVDGRSERRRLNGFAATHFVGTRLDAQGRPQEVRVSVVSGPGRRSYLLQYVAGDAQALARHLPALQAAESSFRAFSASDRAAARPWNVRTATYPKGGFEALARQSPLLKRVEDQLRLLNGFYGKPDEPRLGERVKVIR
jgi:predicted Zn-dependent protease